mgnify:CR=1 FL=1
MKRKPMLFKKIGNNYSCEKRTVALLGINRGAGVTYTGMLLSNYFGTERRIKTAFLECNDHRDFERLQASYEWNKEDGYSFSFDRVTYYKNVAPNDISGILSEDYGCYILDFGTDFNFWKEEFMRCGTKIIIGDRAVWNRYKAVEFLKLLEDIRGNGNWIYMIPCAGKRDLIRLSKETGKKFIKIPYEQDSALLSEETVKLFLRLFG